MSTPTESETPASLRALADECDAKAKKHSKALNERDCFCPEDHIAERGKLEDYSVDLRARADAMEDKNPDACEHGEPLPGPCEKCDAPECDFMSVRFGCCTLAIGHPGAHVFAPSRETPPVEPDGHTAHAVGPLAIERLSFSEMSHGLRAPKWGYVGFVDTMWTTDKGKARQAASMRLLAAAYTSYDRHFGQHAVQAAEDDELGAAISTAGEAVAALTFLRPQLVTEHRLLLDEALTPLRAFLARVQRREA